LAAICKNFNFLNIQLLEYEKEINSISFAKKLKLINRYYDLNHKSYYNYLYTKNISILSNFIKKKKLTDFSTVIIVNSKNFSKIIFNKLLLIFKKKNDKISLIVLKKKYIKYKKIVNFQYICEINGYFIFLNNKIIKKFNGIVNIKKIIKENIIKYLFYYIIAYFSYFLGLIIKIKYYFKKKFR
jgi:hypothetical protein